MIYSYKILDIREKELTLELLGSLDVSDDKMKTKVDFILVNPAQRKKYFTDFIFPKEAKEEKNQLYFKGIPLGDLDNLYSILKQ